MRVLFLMMLLLFCPHSCFSALTSSKASSLATPQEIDAFKPDLTVLQRERWSYLVGKWFGQEATKDFGNVMWITERDNKGNYKIHFKIVDVSGKVEERIEVGEWGVSGPIYFTIFKGTVDGDGTTPTDPTDPYNRDAYKIIRLDDKFFEYESFDSGNKYTAKKVPSNFTFPK